jgi:hypothetical protein
VFAAVCAQPVGVKDRSAGCKYCAVWREGSQAGADLSLSQSLLSLREMRSIPQKASARAVAKLEGSRKELKSV